MFNALNILGSGITANKEWLEVSSNNIVNMNTTRTKEGGPYHRQSIILESKKEFDNLFQKEIGNGVKVKKIVEDKKEDLVYNPTHPDANAEGIVRMPAINLAAEMSNLMMAQRGYEANVTTLNATKQIMQKELEIGRI